MSTRITQEAKETYPILGYFGYEHLPISLQVVSAPFYELARDMAQRSSLGHPEVEAGLRKLLEAKDCFVRASLFHDKVEENK